MCEVRLWGGIGKKKSNKGKQWYLRDRVYDSDGISPSFRYWLDDCGVLLACLFVDDGTRYVACLGGCYDVLVWV